MSDRLNSILDFLLFVDQSKSVERQIHVGGGSRKENTAEHSWHMALYALLLADEIETEIDIGHTIKLILVHDLIEIVAGDTGAFEADEERLAQIQREQEAADILFSKLPIDLEHQLRGLWGEFESGHTPESKIARALDRLQAVGQGVISKGKAWRDDNVDERRLAEFCEEALLVDPTIYQLFGILCDRGRVADVWDKNS